MPRILVIDDEAAIRALLRAMLERVGYDVVDAANGAEGLRAYAAAPTALVITDLAMPGMDGLEVIRALHRAVPPATVIAISGDPQALTRARTLIPHTFAKPLPLRHVLAVQQRLFQYKDRAYPLTRHRREGAIQLLRTAQLQDASGLDRDLFGCADRARRH